MMGSEKGQGCSSSRLCEKEADMKVQITGCGCTKTNILQARVRQALYQLNADAELCQVKDPEETAGLGGIMLPGVFVDGKRVIENRLPSVEELVQLLRPFCAEA